MQGVMRQFEGFGVRHLDPLYADLKFATYSYRITRDRDGWVRLQYKQYMRSPEWHPRDQEGPSGGHRMFIDGFDPSSPPQFEAEPMTAMNSLPEVLPYLKVRHPIRLESQWHRLLTMHTRHHALLLIHQMAVTLACKFSLS